MNVGQFEVPKRLRQDVLRFMADNKAIVRTFSGFFDKEETLMAILDMDALVKARTDFDVIGHYSRPDEFKTEVKARICPGKRRGLYLYGV